MWQPTWLPVVTGRFTNAPPMSMVMRAASRNPAFVLFLEIIGCTSAANDASCASAKFFILFYLPGGSLIGLLRDNFDVVLCLGHH